MRLSLNWVFAYFALLVFLPVWVSRSLVGGTNQIQCGFRVFAHFITFSCQVVVYGRKCLSFLTFSFLKLTMAEY